MRRGVHHALRRLRAGVGHGREWDGRTAVWADPTLPPTHALHAGVGLEARASASKLRGMRGMKAPRKILTLGEPVLRKVCRALTVEEIRSSKIHRLLDDMHAVMRTATGNGGEPAVGLAAPQVGADVRVVLFSSDPEAETLEYKPPKLELINPKIVKVLNPKKRMQVWENCLSIPGLTGLVTRPRELIVEYYDREANLHSLHLQGFAAVVLQHEVDHLDGVLFIDRSDIRDLAFWDVFLRRVQDGEIEIAMELEDEEQ